MILWVQMLSTLGTLECHNILLPSGSVTCIQGDHLHCLLPKMELRDLMPLPRSLAEVLAFTVFGVVAMAHALLSVVLSEAFSGSHTELA